MVGSLESKERKMEKENNFLEKITIQDENFTPFEKGTEIIFWWKEQIQQIIEFYLNTTKKIKEGEKWVNEIDFKNNSERFKINCIVWNNWAGKSMLLKYLYDNNSGKEVILDDFFAFSSSIDYSVNKELLKEWNYNNFYFEVFNFLGNEDYKNTFSSFLNLWKKYEKVLHLSINNHWRSNKKVSFLWNSNKNNDYKDVSNNTDFLNNNIDFEKSFTFFTFLYEWLEKKENPLLKELNLNSSEIKKLWLSLSDLFLSTLNKFDLMPYDIDWNMKSQWIKSEKYLKYKECLKLLKFYLSIFDELNNKEIFFDKYYYEWKKSYLDSIIDNEKKYFLEIIKNIKENLMWLEKLLSFIEKKYEENSQVNLNIYLKIGFKSYFTNYKWEKEPNIFDKLGRSNHSSQSSYLIKNLIYWFSDLDNIDNTDSNLFEKHLYEIIDSLSNFRITREIKKISNIWKNESDFLDSLIFRPIWSLDLQFSDEKITKSFNNLSWWEKTILTRFTNVYMKIIKEYEKFKLKLKNDWKTDKEIKKEAFNFIILIDEPDLHLHLEWQRQYIQKLIDVFSTLDKNIKLHFIIATHSPFIISDLPVESLILLEKDKKENYVKIKTYDRKKEHKEFKNLDEFNNYKQENKTFWANYIDLIQNWFFFQENRTLIWSFAEDIIWEWAKNELSEILLKSRLFDLDVKEKYLSTQIESLSIDKSLLDTNLETPISVLRKEIKSLKGKKKEQEQEKKEEELKKLNILKDFKATKKEVEKIKKEVEKVKKTLWNFKSIKDQIWDEFLKDNLLYFKFKDKDNDKN